MDGLKHIYPYTLFIMCQCSFVCFYHYHKENVSDINFLESSQSAANTVESIISIHPPLLVLHLHLFNWLNCTCSFFPKDALVVRTAGNTWLSCKVLGLR